MSQDLSRSVRKCYVQMQRIEKTVFLSYRRTNVPWALAISQNLSQHGFDVFFDFNGIASGDFAKVILENIKARAHFVVLLTPSALDRCADPQDWLRREIETAIETRRNIVPLTLEGFDFATPTIVSQLTGQLAPLKGYNALSVPAEYFSEAMNRLRERYLNVPLDAVLHPASAHALQVAKSEQVAASAAPAVTEQALTAQQLFERGFNAAELDEKIWYLTQAVRLAPPPSEAPPPSSDHADYGPHGDSRDQLNLEQLLRARTELLSGSLHELEHSFDITLEALGEALDVKSSDPPGHSKRVTAYTIALARAMGIPPARIKIIARGVFLRDIGKMTIPDEILKKAPNSDSNENETSREHCARGYKILRTIPFLREAAEVVLSQQERYDGTGYPNGLRGDAIPVGARIFAVAEALDYITTNRRHTRARDFHIAREKILAASGKQFDPRVVEAFLKIPNELWLELKLEIERRAARFDGSIGAWPGLDVES